VSGYVVDRADHDDLFQEILVAIWKALPAFRGECALRTFIFRIGHNRAATFTSRQRAHAPLELVAAVADPRPGAAQELMAQERANRLRDAVRGLPHLLRETVMLSLEGLTTREIAQVVGATENNINVRLSRGRAALRALLTGEEE
jgi:RNA polymerase sigma factor (sigma-70 family)